MALWADLRTAVYTLTNRPDLVEETNAALRLAIRTAHRSGKYWRDLDVYQATAVSTASSPQQIAAAGTISGFRQLATLRDRARPDIYFSEVRIDDVVDADGFFRTNVYWALGSFLYIRAKEPTDQYTLEYYRSPNLADATNVFSWIADDYPDVVTFLAAATVCGLVGEESIKRNMESLAALAIKDLQEDSIEFTGR